MTSPDCKKHGVEGAETLDHNRKRAIEAGLWFDDGNIILIADGTPFKVHQSLLSQKSEVFRDMFTLPTPTNIEDLMDGTPVVHMSDNWEDLSDVLTALYNSQK